MANAKQDKFEAHYEAYLNAVREGLREELGVTELDDDAENPSSASHMLRAVFDELLSSNALQAVSRVAEQEMSSEGRRALGWEMKFVAERKFKAEEARTAKDSLEKLLGKKLPKPIKDLLEVLNEILKIVSGRDNGG